MHTRDVVVPAVRVGPPVKVDAFDTPALLMAHPATAVFAVPVFVSLTTHTSVAAVHDVTCALTWAELVNDPNRPNTNPAMAMAAMSVIAMRMTVARTGLTAFLVLPMTIFIAMGSRNHFIVKSYVSMLCFLDTWTLKDSQ